MSGIFKTYLFLNKGYTKLNYDCLLLSNYDKVDFAFFSMIFRLDLIITQTVGCLFFFPFYGTSYGKINHRSNNCPASITHFRRKKGVRVMVFNATFNNISIMSWRSVL